MRKMTNRGGGRECPLCVKIGNKELLPVGNDIIIFLENLAIWTKMHNKTNKRVP